MKKFRHRLLQSYNALPKTLQTLSNNDAELLAKVDVLYRAKAFEYVQPGHAARGYSEFPDLDELAHLAKTLFQVALKEI